MNRTTTTTVTITTPITGIQPNLPQNVGFLGRVRQRCERNGDRGAATWSRFSVFDLALKAFLFLVIPADFRESGCMPQKHTSITPYRDF